MGPYMGSLGTEEVHCGLRSVELILAVKDLGILHPFWGRF